MPFPSPFPQFQPQSGGGFWDQFFNPQFQMFNQGQLSPNMGMQQPPMDSIGMGGIGMGGIGGIGGINPMMQFLMMMMQGQGGGGMGGGGTGRGAIPGGMFPGISGPLPMPFNPMQPNFNFMPTPFNPNMFPGQSQLPAPQAQAPMAGSLPSPMPMEISSRAMEKE